MRLADYDVSVSRLRTCNVHLLEQLRFIGFINLIGFCSRRKVPPVNLCVNLRNLSDCFMPARCHEMGWIMNDSLEWAGLPSLSECCGSLTKGVQNDQLGTTAQDIREGRFAYDSATNQIVYSLTLTDLSFIGCVTGPDEGRAPVYLSSCVEPEC